MPALASIRHHSYRPQYPKRGLRTRVGPSLPTLVPFAVLLCLGGCVHRTAVTADPSGHEAQTPATPTVLPLPEPCPLSTEDYPWPRSEGSYSPLALRIAPPEGFTRVETPEGSWGQWLRYLPLRTAGTPVRSREGSVIVPGDDIHLAAVIDMDVYRHQECADTIVRLRAEYLRHADRPDEIAFKCGGAQTHSWARWRQGYRPREAGNGLSFSRVGEPDGSRKSFEGYLASVFAWCGTYHLATEGQTVAADEVAVGDFLASGGSPGHAVLLVDLARDGAGRTCALIAQGYMPAQTAHVMSPGGDDPWFRLDDSAPIDTPFWGAFDWSHLRRFD